MISNQVSSLLINVQIESILSSMKKPKTVVGVRAMKLHHRASILASLQPLRTKMVPLKCLIFLILTINATSGSKQPASNSISSISINPPDPDPAIANQTLIQTSPTIIDFERSPLKTNKTSSVSIDPQSTELSSMYVQIPIAEPSDSSNPDSQIQQQILASDGSTSSSAGSQDQKSWSGNWPRKFQIGYIKQSDLHQVLLESLKNEPFTTIGGSSGGSTASQSKSVSTGPAVGGASKTVGGTSKGLNPDAGSLMKERSKVGPAPWQNNGYNQQSNRNTPRQHQNGQQIFKGSMDVHYRPSVMPHQGNGLFGRGLVASVLQNYRQMNHQLPFHQGLNHMGHQVHAGSKHFGLHDQKSQGFSTFGRMPQQQQIKFPASMLKNQPIYTINNQPQSMPQLQEQLDLNQVQMIDGQFAESPPISAPPKSSEYLSSLWKPVTSTEQSVAHSGTKTSGGLDQPISAGLNDGFDDDSSQNSVGANKESMNRHPALNSYLDTQTGKGSKLSPAMISRQQSIGSGSGSKLASSAKSNSDTKGGDSGVASRGAAKGGSDLGTKRRGLPDGSTTTASPNTNSTTISPQSSTEETSPTTDPSVLQTTSPSSLVSSTTAESETQEPESEVVETDTETTEPSVASGAESTTTVASNQPEGSTSTASSVESSKASSTPASSTTSSESSELEVSSPSGTQSSREETTPSSKNTELEGSTTAAGAGKSSAESLTDEALVASVGKSEISKSNQQQRGQQGSGKKTRSSERLTTTASSSGNRQSATKKPANNSNKLITKKPVVLAQTKAASSGAKRSGKQHRGSESESVKGSKGSKGSSRTGKQKSSDSTKSKSAARAKQTRMANQFSSPIAQVVSMSAAQAQSTAQTLASILLSRCLTSQNCAHLLDVCSTKQAAFTWSGDSSSQPNDALNSIGAPNEIISNGSSNGNWSRPVGLVSSHLMSLAQALQADRVLRVFPQWRESLEGVMDQEAQTGYTLILPSNEAMDQLPQQTIDLWLSNSELMGQIVENHILDSAEAIELYGNSRGVEQASQRTRLIRGTRNSIQVSQHRNRMVTMNGKRVVYANQPAPCKYRE